MGKIPHFHINNADVMWSNVNVMWNIVEECGCFVDVMWNIVEECGCFTDVMLNIVEECGCFVEKCGWNVDPPNLHISTFHNLTKSSPLLGRSS